MTGVQELFETGKGVLAVAIVVAATVLAVIGTMTIEQWKSTVIWIFGAYATASAVRHGLAQLRAPAKPATAEAQASANPKPAS